MNPKKFVEIWESRHEKLSVVHRDLMLSRLHDYGIRRIDEEWARRAIVSEGLKKLEDIYDRFDEYMDSFVKENREKILHKVNLDVVQNNREKRLKSDISGRGLSELWRLSKSKSPVQRAQIALDPQASIEILNNLSDDKKDYVRIAVAKNSKTSIDTLDKLAKDQSSKVRLAVALNLRTSIQTLELLMRDNDTRISKAAENSSKKPRIFNPSKSFYLIGMTKEEEKKPELLVFDTNFILSCEDWASNTSKKKHFGDLNESVRPVIELLRNIKNVYFDQALLESSWQLPATPVSSTRDLIRINRQRIGVLSSLMATLRNVDQEILKSWCSAGRNFTIPYEKIKVEENVHSMSIIKICELWLSVCILLHSVKALNIEKQRHSIDEIGLGKRILYFKSFISEIETHKLSISGELLFLARMGFFGGHIRFGTRIFRFSDIVKEIEWESKGLLAVGRNIAFDLFLISTARELRFTLAESKKLNTAIVTADIGILAILQYVIEERFDESLDQVYAFYKWPPSSDYYSNARLFADNKISSIEISFNKNRNVDEDFYLNKLLTFFN